MQRWENGWNKTAVLEVSAVALLWWGLFELNRWWFSSFEVTAFANWVFLPAGLRVAAVLVLGRTGVVGLFLGAMWTSHPQLQVNMVESLVLSSLSALSPYLGVLLCARLLHLKAGFKGLTAMHLLCIALACAAISVQAHNLYFLVATGNHQALVSVVPMFAGDVLGTLLLLGVAGPALRWYEGRRKRA